MIALWVCVIAVIVGVWAGFFLASLCYARREADDAAEEWYRGE